MTSTEPVLRSAGGWRGIPGGIWALGLVSMFMDISSEMIHALLPVYLVTVFATPAIVVGMIEGIAEATAAVTKIFSGALSDWLGRRKLLAAAGYGLAALTKPIFPLAPSVGWLVAARFIDRIGKGLRGAPRDALVADLSPPEIRGASFGLRQSLDTVGAFAGPLLAVVFMWLTANHYTLVFWIAVIPAMIAFLLIAFLVKEPARPVPAERPRWPLRRRELRRLGRGFWLVTAIAVVFTLARFSEAFLILRAEVAGLAVFLVPGVLVLMNVVYALSAYPAGVLSDRMDRATLLIAGLAVLVLADAALALSASLVGIAIGIALWGLHMGLTQGLLAALVADCSPQELRGTAFGMFNLMTGMALLAASVIAGAIWDWAGPAWTFASGAAFAMTAMAGLAAWRRSFPTAGQEANAGG